MRAFEISVAFYPSRSQKGERSDICTVVKRDVQALSRRNPDRRARRRRWVKEIRGGKGEDNSGNFDDPFINLPPVSLAPLLLMKWLAGECTCRIIDLANLESGG